MKRFHVHLSVRDLAESVRFYSTVFGVPPSVEKPDYAKWMLEDPRLNFAISTGGTAGLSHLGLQADSAEELAAMRSQVAGRAEILDEPETSCCYARSSKHWVRDPQGIRWEAFHTLGAAEGMHCATRPADKAASPCCG
ncbi:MAG: VOC family protein [Terriglobales bacterium]